MVALTAKRSHDRRDRRTVEKRFFGAHRGDAYAARTRPFLVRLALTVR